MARVKRGVTAHARHKKVLELAKGYRGRGIDAYRIAIEKVEKALRYAYRDRRNKKRDFRGLWIQRINAGAREHGLTYSQFIHGLKLAGHRARPQGSVRPRDPRARGVRGVVDDRPGGARRGARRLQCRVSCNDAAAPHLGPSPQAGPVGRVPAMTAGTGQMRFTGGYMR